MTILFLLSVGLNIFLCFCCYYLAKEYQTEHMINEEAKKILEEKFERDMRGDEE